MLKPPVRRPKPAVKGALWPDAKDRVAQGLVTPFVSNYMSAALFGVQSGQIARSWAEDIESPLGEEQNQELAHVAQFLAVKKKNRIRAKQDYLMTLGRYLLVWIADKDRDVDQELVQKRLTELDEAFATDRFVSRPFSELASELGYPCFDRPEANPFRMLAELPLPIYITTSHHQFLEYALRDAQKRPVREIFYWGDHLERIPSIFDTKPLWEPTPQEPLVYHLYGLDVWPESMVLTEDDFLDLLNKQAELRYLTRVAEARGEETTAHRRRDIPAVVSTALSGTALLTLGYNVYSWEFRVLFRGLIQPYGESRRGREAPEGFCMQFEPGTRDGVQGDAAGIKAYLEEYFDVEQFRVYWGSVEQCVGELYGLWRG